MERPASDYAVGVRNGWTEVGPAHKRRYLSFVKPKKGSVDSVGELLQGVRNGLLRSSAFARYVAKITTLQVTGFRDEIRRFRPGLDYSVAHYGGMSVIPRLDATLCFVDDQGDDLADSWESGDVGGFECYIEAEGEEGESAEAAEVYRSNTKDDGDLLSVSAASNVISLVMRDQGIMRFIKYVSYGAPGSRWDISMEYEIAQETTGAD
jgi:hypothetical protein